MRRVGSVLLVITIVLVGCSGDDEIVTAPSTTHQTSAPATTATAVPTTTTVAPVESGPVGVLSEWDGIRATLAVPLDRDDPDGPSIEVPVWRREATGPEKRIGVLLVNPGGPGNPAGFLATDEGVFTADLYTHFDIVALDPRGTFPETAIHCLTDWAEYESSADWSPDTPGEIEAMDAAIQDSVDSCVTEHSEMLPHVSTMDTVHDMAALVRALGEDQASYLGTSYGSMLGAAFLTTYPELVRAAVLDAAYDPNDDPFEREMYWVGGRETLLVRIIEECAASPDCPIAGDVKAALARVAAAADSDPFDENRFFTSVNRSGFETTINAVAYQQNYDELLAAVAAADTGNPVLLQMLYHERAESMSPQTGLAIFCVDYPYRGPVSLPSDALDILEEMAPTYYSVFPVPEGFDPLSIPDWCERWPVGPDLLPSPLSGEGAGPVLVVTATGDVITPTASAIALSEQLVNDTLLIVEDDRHISYDTASTSPARTCATDLIDDFLITLTAPPDGTVCGP